MIGKKVKCLFCFKNHIYTGLPTKFVVCPFCMATIPLRGFGR